MAAYRKSLDSNFIHFVNVISLNGKQGLIDYTGAIVVEPVYSSFDFPFPSYGDEEEIWCFYETDDQYSGGPYDVVDKNYSVHKRDYLWGHAGQYVGWLWDVNVSRIMLWEATEQGLTCWEKKTSKAVPVQEVEIDYSALIENTSMGEIYYSLPLEKDYTSWFRSAGKMGYALYDSLIIPCEYDQAQVIQDGLGAVRRGNKWFYINENGEIVNETGYDDAYSAPYREEDVEFTKDLSAFRYVYDFSDGLAAVNRGGLWGYIDRSGVEVIPCQFEATRPLYKGKAWIKEDGLWGVADLSSYISASYENRVPPIAGIVQPDTKSDGHIRWTIETNYYGLALRKGPYQSYDSIIYMDDTAVVIELGYNIGNDEWVFVQYDNLQGWCSRKYLRG